MKKTLTIVLALVLALSMLASFAFVLNPGSGSSYKPEKSPLNVGKFYATDDLALAKGARIYSALADNTNKAYAKNEIIRFALELEVLNHLVPANGVDATTYTGDIYTTSFTVSSDTVDFALSNIAGQQALHTPLDSVLVNAINSKGNDVGEGLVYNPTTGLGTFDVDVDKSGALPSVSDFTAGSMTLNVPTGTTAKVSYAFIFSGVTKGEITDQGLAKLTVGTTPASTINDGSVKVVAKNGRTYIIHKDVTPADVKHTAVTASNAFYTVDTVGYRIYLVTSISSANVYTVEPIAQLDTERVRWNAGTPLAGEDVEGIGISLGVEKIQLAALAAGPITAGTVAAPAVPAPASGALESTLVFKNVLGDGTIVLVNAADGLPAFGTAAKAAFDTMLADFGFSMDPNYTYKLLDSNFVAAAAATNVKTATYNNGTVVPVEPEEEEDLDEGTPDEELPEEEDVDEEDVVEDEDEVPAETGDFASDIALALTAAAIVAAAALAFVMKKARD